MIVIARRYGQLGNRLFLYSYLIAAARHYGVPLLNPCFAEYADLFPRTRHDLWCRYDDHLVADRGASSAPGGRVVRSRVPSRRARASLMNLFQTGTKALHLAGLRHRPAEVIRLARGQQCDLEGPRFREAIASGRPLLLQGWWFRSQRLFEEHSESIRDFFALDPFDRQVVHQCTEKARGDADVLVGVHIRRGDYAGYLGGRYFYQHADYARWMHQTREQLSGKRVRFLVCTNEPMDHPAYASLPIVRGPGSAIGDLYALAETDWMLGPPSTFTGWAAFYGKKPLVTLQSQSDRVIVPQIAPRRQAVAAGRSRRSPGESAPTAPSAKSGDAAKPASPAATCPVEGVC